MSDEPTFDLIVRNYLTIPKVATLTHGAWKHPQESNKRANSASDSSGVWTLLLRHRIDHVAASIGSRCQWEPKQLRENTADGRVSYEHE
jgi:hypothetical protein